MTIQKINVNNYSQNYLHSSAEFTIPYAYIRRRDLAIIEGVGVSAEWHITDYIPVAPNMRFVVHSFGNDQTSSVVLYSYDKIACGNYLSNDDISFITIIDDIVPEGCYYMVCCSRISPQDNQYANICFYYEELTLQKLYQKTYPYYFDKGTKSAFLNENGTVINISYQTSAWMVTDFIPVIYNMRYEIRLYAQPNVSVISFYDKDKNHIRSIIGLPREDDSHYTASEESGFIELGVYYIRCCTYNTLNNNYNTYIKLDNEVNQHNYLSRLPYKNDFIVFTVPINQYIVSETATADECIDNESSIIDVQCYLKLPSSYMNSGSPSKLVMICHGAGSSLEQWMASSVYNNIVNYLNNSGYAVFDCNGWSNDSSGYNFWGCPKGCAAWRKAYDYIIMNYNVEENVCIYGFSMGGLTAMNLALNNFPNIKCIALGSPVLKLDSCWGASPHDNMILGYGSEDYSKFSPGNNPYANIYTQNNTLYYNKQLPPLKIWYGSTETNRTGQPYVEKNDAINLVTALKNSNQTAYYREVDGAGHEICYGANLNVVNEIVMYFNRFNY